MVCDLGQLILGSWLNRQSGCVCFCNRVASVSFEIEGQTFDARDVIVRSRDGSGQIDDFVVFGEGGKVRRYLKYKPLVYFTVFADHLFRLLAMSLASIVEFGEFEGDVLIITDKSSDFVRPFVPDALADRVKIWNYPVSDILDICCARYQVALWPHAELYQPLLYIDSDVIVDAPINKVLSQIAVEDKLCFQGEPSHQLCADVGVGSARFQEDGIDVRGKSGYNSGIMGVPKLSLVLNDMQCIVEGTHRYSVFLGTRDLAWCDQATGNYVMYMLGGVEQSILYNSVRWGGQNALHGGRRPKGFVHLWGARDKEEEMRDLLAMLQSLPRLSSVPWIVYESGERLELDHLGIARSQVRSSEMKDA